MSDPFSDLMSRAGAAGRTLQDAYKSSVQPELQQVGGDLFSGLGGILTNLQRPAGALRAGLTGNNPISGFEHPDNYRFYQPTDSAPQRILGGALEGALDPINLIGAKWMSPLGKDAPFLTRFATEAAINAGANVAAESVSTMLPDNTPPWLRTLAPVGAALAAGAFGAGQASRLGGSLERIRPSMFNDAVEGIAPAADDVTSALRQSLDQPNILHTNPSAVLADITTPDTMAGGMQATMRAQEANVRLASLDTLGPQLARDTLNGATTGVVPEVATDFALDANSLMSERYRTLQGSFAANSVQYMAETEALAKMTPMVKAKFTPTWMARVVNGMVNRDPEAANAARVGHNYIMGQQTPVAMVMHDMDTFVKSELGDVGEKVSLRVDAPNDVRQAFLKAQEGQYGNAAIGIIAEHPQAFNLTDNQLAKMRDLQFLTDYDARLSQQFGVDTSFLYKGFNEAIDDARKAGNATEVGRLQALKAGGATTSDVKRVENYARHMTTLLGPDGKELSQEVFPRFLGSERSFQQHRMFDSWVDVMNSAADRNQFVDRVTGAMRAAAADGDTEEVQRLQDLIQSGIQVGVRRASFAESVGERLGQSARQRGESLAMRTVKENGGDIRAEEELKSLLNASRIPDWLRIPAETAGFIRSMQLRADVSLFGVQIWGATAMGRGLRGGIEGNYSNFLKTIGTEDGWARYRMVNAAKMNNWVLHDLALNESVLELPDDLNLMKRRANFGERNIGGTLTAPTNNIAARGANSLINGFEGSMDYMDKVQFSRMATAWKLDMADHTLGLLKAARDGNMGFGEMLTHPSLAMARIGGTFAGQTDDQLMRAASSFSNNLFGGLNATAQGRTAVQNLVESVFMLTPGFTRGTVSIGLQAANLAKWTPEAALARDFAVRGTLMAGMMVKGLTYALNGYDKNGRLKEANVTDPSKADWMTIPLPNGTTIAPLSRWRGTGKIVGETVEKLLRMEPIEAGQTFGADALRWATYRQSGLVTDILGDPVGDVFRAWGPKDELGQPTMGNAGNGFTRDQGLLNLITNPSGDPAGQIGQMAMNNLPVAAGAGAQVAMQGGSPTDVGIALGAELLGQGQRTPTKMERSVRAAGGSVAAELGIDEETIKNAIISGQNPLYLKDENGKFLLTSAQRSDGVQRVAAATGLSEDIVRNGGRATTAQRQEIMDGIKTSQLDNYFAGLDNANKQYGDAMKQAQDAVDRGMPPGQVSKFISDARTKRSAAKGAVEQLNPAAIAFLRSDAQSGKANAKDALNSAIAADAYSKDFFDPETLSFDFNARDQHYADLRVKYGQAFDDWLKVSDAKKTPLERSRDHAFERLGTYFRVGDDIWGRMTGGALGETEKDFDRQMTAQLAQGGVSDPGMQQYVLSHLKANMKPIVAAHSATTKVRNLMRASDPVLEQDVTTWLGAQPIALKKLSRVDRGLVNSLLVQAD